MQRYLAFAWRPGDPEGESASQVWSDRLAADARWRRALVRRGLEVWTAAGVGAPVTAFGEFGPVLVGAAFDRRGAMASAGAPPDGQQDPMAMARHISRTVWGRFVALVADEGEGGLWAYREPSGMVEAMTWRRGPVAAVSDDLADLPPGLGPPQLALDWDVICRLVGEPHEASHLSPLQGVQVIGPGELVPLGGGEPVSLWRPRDWTCAPVDLDAERLRDQVLQVVSAMAAAEARLIVEVSGGLDSAIVAAALVAGGHRDRIATAINYYGLRREGDERPWAQAVSRHLRLPLLEVPKAIGEICEADLSERAGLAAPAFMGLDAPRDRDAAARVTEFGATATFGGQGGDAVFYQSPTALVLSDFLRPLGPGRWNDPFVAAVARWQRRPVWSLLRDARRGRDRISDLAPRSSPFWGPRMREAGPVRPHPWLLDLDRVSPAKRVQVRQLLAMQAGWTRSRRGARAGIVHPLLAQPVVETCLAAPVWQLLAGGQERGLARAAFSSLLPERVLRRRSKGILTSEYNRRVAASLPFLRPFLLDGVLASAGVLDRSAMEAALDADQLIWNAAGARLTRAALVEAWVRRWQGYVPDSAQAPRMRL